MEAQQNICARLVTGCVRATKKEALLAVADIPPFSNVAAERCVNLANKIKRLPPDTPSRIVLEQKSIPRLKNRQHEFQKRQEEPDFSKEDAARPYRNCFRRQAQSSHAYQVGSKTPVDVHVAPPWEPTEGVKFNLKASEECAKSDSLEKKRETGLGVLNSLDKPEILVFSDGSVEEAVRNGGGAAVIERNQEKIVVKKAAGMYCSSFHSELIAIQGALEVIASKGWSREKIYLCTDSLSALKYLERGAESSQNSASKEIWNLLKDCPDISLIWVPSHCGIELNEEADRLANEARGLDQTNVPLELTTLQAVSRRERKHKDKNYMGGYARYAGMNDLGRLRRKDAVAVNQVRAGASTLCKATRHKMNMADNPNCEDCGEIDTVKHMVYDCQRGARARWDLAGPDSAANYFEDNPKELLKLLQSVGRVDIA